MQFFFALGLVSSAQTTSTTSAPASVHGRKENQQDRIASGIRSGQLTTGETRNLEGREANLNREIREDRAADSGKLTEAEKNQVNRQQNHLSHSIYDDKHNASVAHYGNEKVGQRRENQQDRIANNVASGRLDANQTAHLENREQGINQQIRADRQANGGKLTGAERQQINGQQNKASKAIRNKKSS